VKIAHAPSAHRLSTLFATLLKTYGASKIVIGQKSSASSGFDLSSSPVYQAGVGTPQMGIGSDHSVCWLFSCIALGWRIKAHVSIVVPIILNFVGFGTSVLATGKFRSTFRQSRCR
jgi:hypothetical protein